MWGLTWFLVGTIFIVGTANFFNFMDGINGIAGITGFIGFGFLAFYFYTNQGLSDFYIVSLVVSFFCLGFLPINMPIARVFMGDWKAWPLTAPAYSWDLALCLDMFVSRSARRHPGIRK